MTSAVGSADFCDESSVYYEATGGGYERANTSGMYY